ncbi:HEAT repeat domain-containing protein, partial [Streptomyces sp. NPDC059233]
LNWFAHQMAGSEDQLVATLLDDELPARRRAAAYTFITYPDPSAALPETLLRALAAETHPAVRETILRALAAQGEHGRDLLITALSDPVADVRSLAAVLMAASTPQIRPLPTRRREALERRLAHETDDSVRETIQRMLKHST